MFRIPVLLGLFFPFGIARSDGSVGYNRLLRIFALFLRLALLRWNSRFYLGLLWGIGRTTLMDIYVGYLVSLLSIFST